ncbi:sigma-70 family RNA polymerase sigma factor [Chitinophaga deserti]|uniref:sigma-70 family RNA polymerase sigma factor n=1 Tax=Chitinophaga deserti TaxID=2164099 RepID=UPI000D6AFF1E|nr:sigma-70 family RNA polymerase sigma factor [Chitinophaga deserti]
MPEEHLKSDNNPGAKDQLIRELFEQHRKGLIVEAYAVLKDMWEAEDVVQDTFVAIWSGNHLSKVEPEKYRAYIFRAVRNNCLSTQRKIQTDDRKMARFIETAPRYEPGEKLEAWDSRDKMSDAVQALPEQRRLAFTKTYLQGKPHLQVAHEMDLKPETVKSHIKIALKNLRDRLKNLR